MLKTFLVTILCFTGIIAIAPAFAQTTADSPTNGHALYANIERNFYKEIGPQSRLYNGQKYDFYDPSIKGNPYLLDNSDWVPGTVVYDGYTYSNVNMLYDMNKDVLVIPLYKSFLKMSLVSSKVSSFDLAGHHFIYVKAGEHVINPLDAGYYDQLYHGKITLLCRRSESIQQTHSFSGNIDSYFLPSLDYYIYKNGQYFTVNSKGEFLNALKDKKKPVRHFVQANGLKFKKDSKEQDMVKLADYYDHITN